MGDIPSNEVALKSSCEIHVKSWILMDLENLPPIMILQVHFTMKDFYINGQSCTCSHGMLRHPGVACLGEGYPYDFRLYDRALWNSCTVHWQLTSQEQLLLRCELHRWGHS